MMTASIALLAVLGQLAPSPSLPWTQVGKNKKATISGLVRWDAAGTRFLAVLDNKKNTDEQISLLTKSGKEWKRTPLEISDPKKLILNDPMRDLEGVCRIPGRADEVLAIGDRGEEQGWFFRFKVSARGVTLLDAFQAPGVIASSDYEGIDLFVSGKRLLAVWGDRGGNGNSARLSAAPLALDKPSHFGTSFSISFKTPFPEGPHARPLGDVRVGPTGIVYVSSVSDPGDEGPFSSAVFGVAQLSFKAGKVSLNRLPTAKLVCRVEGRKIEAIEFLGKGWFFGTDDEDAGGWVTAFGR